MKTPMKQFLRMKSKGVIATGIVLMMTTSLSASILEIQFTGLDIGYDGTDITSLTSPDTLSAMSLFVDGIEVDVLTSDISIDLMIPGVSGLSSVSGAVTTIDSAVGGTLMLAFGGGDFLDLTLDPVLVTYVDVPAVGDFVLGATIGTITGQSLPEALIMSDPVAVSFSTNVDSGSTTDDGAGTVTGFTASGTGEVEGEVEVDPHGIPEPQSLVLGIIAMMSIAFRPRWI